MTLLYMYMYSYTDIYEYRTFGGVELATAGINY